MFEFNPYSSLLLPSFLQGILFAALCFMRYRKEVYLADLFLGALLLLLTVRVSFWMLGFAGWYDGHDLRTTFMFYFPFNTLPLIGPCLYFYFLSVTNRDFRLSRAKWPHLVIPALLLILYIVKFAADFLLYRPFPDSEGFQFGTRGPMAEIDKSIVVYMIAYLSLGYYFIIILKNLKSYKSYLTANFAETERIDLRWLKNMIWFTIAAGVFFFSFYLANLFIKINYVYNWYPYLVLGALIYYVGINGYFHSGGLFRLVYFSEAENMDMARLPAFAELEYWKQNLEKLMKLEQLYLDPSISLSSLSAKLGTNSSVVSRIINEGLDQNFNDYINGLRVNAVLRQFNERQYEKYSLMGIAWDCGFNSKTTFNRSFKKVTGKTPSEYIKEITLQSDNVVR